MTSGWKSFISPKVVPSGVFTFSATPTLRSTREPGVERPSVPDAVPVMVT